MKKIVINDQYQGEHGRVIVEFDNGRRFVLSGDGTVEEWRNGHWGKVKKVKKR